MAPVTRKRKSAKLESIETKPIIAPKLEPSETKPTKIQLSETKPKTPKIEPSETKPSETKPITPKIEIDQVISNQTDVALTLTKHILQNNNTSNVVLSPLSLQLVLSLVAAGSEGQTLEQLLSFLKAESTDELNSFASHLVKHVFTGGSPSGEPTLSLANGVWIDKSLSFKPFFSKVVDDVYNAVSDVVDFQNKASEATDKVNSWIEKETNGLVKDTVPPDLFDDETKIVFANAIYFKGSWVDPFHVWETETFDFNLLNDGCVQVPFMTNHMMDAYISAFDDFKVLKLPYMRVRDTRKISMYIFLPDAKDGLPTLVDKLSSESGFLERHLPNHSQVLGKFWIPKFKVSFGFEAKEALKEFGVIEPFIPGGLDKMVDSEKIELLYVSNIFQKSSIEVNESGTEAAASSRLSMCGGGCPPVRIDFVADHPFLFFIREDTTGVVLFVGQVLNPLVT
ncbi:SERPIN domain-containing protein [Heracleum sosnowskyi]|uniref:SERPIN domain-containing protein n=1 Tax=Heracleum sosnowskyi TaxID=360622 RepID=A0AAD8J120_9APIA|nr:SERPIN domain-containing protein [Heracleum sosnowskyi]